MATRIPVITSPCPLRWSALPEPGRDHCGHCDRQVHNLDGMSSLQRESFLRGCNGKVCVAYTVSAKRQRRNVALGAGLLAAMAGSHAMAGELDLGLTASSGPTSPVAPAASVAEEDVPLEDLEIILAGGVESGDTVRFADESELASPDESELPVIGTSEWLPTPAAK
jgi:hypothetical protein